MFKFCKKCVETRRFRARLQQDGFFGLIRFCDICGAEE